MSRNDNNTKRKLSFLGFNTRGGDGNPNPDEVQLDDEMEKIFGVADAKEKFDMDELVDVSPKASAQSKPSPDYVYIPMKKLPPANVDTKGSSVTSPDTMSGTTITSPDSTAPSSPITVPLSKMSSGDEPQLSQRPPSYNEVSDTSADVKHVVFDKRQKKDSTTADDSLGEDSEVQKKRRKSRHPQKYRKYSLQEYGGFKQGERRVSVQPEDETLDEADIDELTSHRSDDQRGMRRPKVQQFHAQNGGQTDTTTPNPKKTIDHSPHEVFVQLDELMGQGEEREWKETARWIKYEEDLEEGADRWGRPHVAPLSFHSLLNLRRCLETGVVLLDLDEKDLTSISYRVVEQMAIDELISENDKPVVLRSLLLKHRHVNEHSHGSFPFGQRRKYSSYTSLQSLWADEGGFVRRCSVCSSNHSRSLSPLPPIPPYLQQQQQQPQQQHSHVIVRQISRRQSGQSLSNNLNPDDKKTRIPPINEHQNGGEHTTVDIKEETYSSSQEDLKKQAATNDSIFKRIPQGAEATTVLVGSVDFLDQPTIAFVRLAEGIPMPSITEVPVPVRFMFILLGPQKADLDYHEVGRSIATLMSSAHFHNIAYKADDRRDLLSAINEFLDDSIVIPPGDWENQALLPFNELKAKKDMIKRRKKKALQAKQKTSEPTVDEEKKLLAAGGDDYPKKPSKNPLERTHRLWGGLINDVKRRYPMYISDIMDGVNTETLAATIFMYFAALSTAITFGGLASDKTNNLIGISETLLSASLVGVFFHALCGQPLVIIGTTGPLLLFDEALYQFCKENDYSFLTIRVYVGMWLVVIALVVSAFEGSVLVRLFTRFTQEIFSALITLIYLVETAQKLVYVYGRHPLLEHYFYKTIEKEPVSAAFTNNVTPADFINETSTEITEKTILNTMTELISNLTNISDEMSTAIALGAPTNVTLLVPEDLIGPLNRPNTALFCTILTLGTFALAYYLKLFRNSHFLGRNARRALGDFGVPISIALFVAMDYMLPQVFTDKLSVPEGISPSDTDARQWVIPMGPVPMWLPFVSGIPAMLVYILVFMETHISELIVDKPERGLKKGSGLHLDIVLLCFLNMVCGFFGMPWHCAATVRSVTHVSAVTIMSRTHAPGDKAHISDVKEQRLSGFFVSLMVGLSVTMAPLLRLIPMSVLFGVFLYMGVASMSGVQLFERIRLLFMPVKHHPQQPFVRRVKSWKMHIFTITQISALAILWAVKSSKFSLAFPFFLILMVPLRQQMTRFFTERELNALDGSQANPDAEDEPDFYEQSSIPA